jgi:hypothetical protein
MEAILTIPFTANEGHVGDVRLPLRLALSVIDDFTDREEQHLRNSKCPRCHPRFDEHICRKKLLKQMHRAVRKGVDIDLRDLSADAALVAGFLTYLIADRKIESFSCESCGRCLAGNELLVTPTPGLGSWKGRTVSCSCSKKLCSCIDMMT